MQDKRYKDIHHWIHKNYGNADHCENPDCEGKSTKYEWAMIHEKGYDYKRENFKMLCISCHRKYDITEEKILKQIESRKGYRHSDEVKQKMSYSHSGIPKSKEHRLNLSKANKGYKYPTVICPHCGKVGGGNAMKQFHFDNCKLKINYI